MAQVKTLRPPGNQVLDFSACVLGWGSDYRSLHEEFEKKSCVLFCKRGATSKAALTSKQSSDHTHVVTNDVLNKGLTLQGGHGHKENLSAL